MSTDERCRHGKSLDNPCDECDEERGCSLAQAPGSASPDEVREALERSVKLQYCERCKYPNDIATGHVLTVHHLDGNKANCADWNLAALCQRCHLRIQGRVKMDQLFFEDILDVSEWFKPHLEGYRRAMTANTEVSGGAKTP